MLRARRASQVNLNPADLNFGTHWNCTDSNLLNGLAIRMRLMQSEMCILWPSSGSAVQQGHLLDEFGLPGLDQVVVGVLEMQHLKSELLPFFEQGRGELSLLRFLLHLGLYHFIAQFPAHWDPIVLFRA